MARPVGHTTDFTKAEETDLHKFVQVLVVALSTMVAQYSGVTL